MQRLLSAIFLFSSLLTACAHPVAPPARTAPEPGPYMPTWTENARDFRGALEACARAVGEDHDIVNADVLEDGVVGVMTAQRESNAGAFCVVHPQSTEVTAIEWDPLELQGLPRLSIGGEPEHPSLVAFPRDGEPFGWLYWPDDTPSDAPGTP